MVCLAYYTELIVTLQLRAFVAKIANTRLTEVLRPLLLLSKGCQLLPLCFKMFSAKGLFPIFSKYMRTFHCRVFCVQWYSKEVVNKNGLSTGVGGGGDGVGGGGGGGCQGLPGWFGALFPWGFQGLPSALKFDFLIYKTHFISLWGVSKMHF